MKKFPAIISICFLFAGCRSFTEIVVENEPDCYRSKVCRTIIGAYPEQARFAKNDQSLCELNSKEAENNFEFLGIETRTYTVKLEPIERKGWKSEGAQSMLTHRFTAGKIDGRWYAVDNGMLPFCNGICRLDEALHGVKVIGSIQGTR